jgi:predicted lipoprotein with Yx(FWY)xxD motif
MLVCGVVLAALAPVGVAACGSAKVTGDAVTPTPTPTPTVNGRAGLRVGQSRLGPILVDASGRTLYFFRGEEPRKALCTSDYLNCPTSWPPLTTTGRPSGRPGVKTQLINTFHRTKPSGTQVTYNRHPLYRYLEDTQPGDVKGQGMFGYWYVLSPSGRPIMRK